MRRQDGVVRLYDRRGHLRRRVHGELELGLLPVVHRQTFHEQGRETRPRAAAETVEHDEPLQSLTLLCEPADALQDQVDVFLANGVVAPGVVVGGVFVASYQLLGVKKLSVFAGSYFICSKDNIYTCLALVEINIRV